MDTSLWSTGDLLAFSGSELWDTLIKWWTHSPYTHVGMLDCSNFPIVMLIQATPEHGVAPMLVKRAIREEGGKCFWVAVKKPQALAINPNYQRDLLDFMTTHFSDLYDWRGIGHFVFPFIKQQKNREYCSELIVQAFREAKLMTSSPQQSPGQLVAQPIFLEPVEVVA